jgi:glycosyltransferase involved in cell wall biosynthesis
MASPRAVVLMSCYNEEQYLGETLPTLLAQTMPDFRAIILDNGSTDGSWGILRDIQAEDSRIQLHRMPTNTRPPWVANFVTEFAFEMWRDCQWFVPHGADDLMAPNYLETILDTAAEHPDANLIFSPWQWIGHPEKGVKRFPAFDTETCHAVHQIPAWAAFTRQLWDDVGGHDEAVPIASDWDWVVRARKALQPVQLQQPMISLRVREGARKSQSDEVHWPTLHRHLCGLAGKPVPEWAQ